MRPTFDEVVNVPDVDASYQTFVAEPVAVAVAKAVAVVDDVFQPNSTLKNGGTKWLNKCLEFKFSGHFAMDTYDVEFCDDLTNGGGDCICWIFIEPKFG